MKNHLVFFLLMTLILSCSNDEDISIVGDFKLTSLGQSNCPNSLENFELDFSNSNCTTIVNLEFCETGVFIFSPEGDFSSTIMVEATDLGEIFELNATGTYTTNGNIVTICIPECEDFEFDGNTLIQNQSNQGCDIEAVFTKI